MANALLAPCDREGAVPGAANQTTVVCPSIKTILTIVIIPLFAVLFWFIIAYCIVENKCNFPPYPQTKQLHNKQPTPSPVWLLPSTDPSPWLPATRIKLQCPKQYCDKTNNNGKCLIYIPSHTKEYHINATDSSNIYTNVTEYEWEADYAAITGCHTSILTIFALDEVGEYAVELRLFIDIKHGGNTLYSTEKICEMQLIVYDSPYFGIDLGTTYSCIAYQHPLVNTANKRRNTTIVIVDETLQGHCIPTAIYFPPNPNANILIGYAAKAKLHKDAANVIYDVKRIIGRNGKDSEIKSFRKEHKFQLTDDEYPKIIIPNRNNMTIRPEQALAAVLIYLVKAASDHYGVPYIRDVVVSTPAIFHDSQRKAVRSACNLAGLNVKQLVVEPSAASIAYIYHIDVKQFGEFNKLFMTFDFGGGTLDCSVLKCVGLLCEVFGVAGNSSLGGIDFDNVIADILREKFKKQHGWVITEEINAEIASKAEDVKKTLTLDSSTPIRLQNQGFYKEVIVTRDEFENHMGTKELLNSAMHTAKMALLDDRFQDQKTKQSNIRAILLIGGSSKMPIVGERLNKEFVDKYQNAIRLIIPDEDPQLMVVKGGAVIGGSMAYLDNSDKNFIREMSEIVPINVTDVLPMSLGFEVCVVDYGQANGQRCHVMDILIPKNSRYPTKGNGIYCQKDARGTTATLNLYEGDSENTNDNVFLTNLEILNVPERNSNVCKNILVELSVDSDGICKIDAKTIDKDGESKEYTKELPIKSNDGSLSEQQIKDLRQQILPWFSIQFQNVIIKAFE